MVPFALSLEASQVLEEVSQVPRSDQLVGNYRI